MVYAGGHAGEGDWQMWQRGRGRLTLRQILQWSLGFIAGLLAAARGDSLPRPAFALRNPAAAGLEIAPLRLALVGRHKSQIATTLGPPPAWIAEAQMAGAAPGGGYWLSDTWYYPLDLRRRVAVAIVFREEYVERVERLPANR